MYEWKKIEAMFPSISQGEGGLDGKLRTVKQNFFNSARANGNGEWVEHECVWMRECVSVWARVEIEKEGKGQRKREREAFEHPTILVVPRESKRQGEEEVNDLRSVDARWSSSSFFFSSFPQSPLASFSFYLYFIPPVGQKNHRSVSTSQEKERRANVRYPRIAPVTPLCVIDFYPKR